MEYFTLSFIVGVLLGFLIVRYIKHKLKILNDFPIRREDTELIVMLLLRTEHHNGLLYLYNQGTNLFITQGSTLHELATNMLNYRKIRMAMVSHENKLFYFVEGKVYMFKDEQMVEVEYDGI